MKSVIRYLIFYSGLLILVVGIYAYQSDHSDVKIRVVGSTTVYPFITTVAEFVMTKYQNQPSPVIEPTGSGIGAKIFCSQNSRFSPQILMTSRPLKESEIALCQKNNISWTKYILGRELFVLVTRKDNPLRNLSIKELFLASAKFVPINNTVVSNPYKNWKDINTNLSLTPIIIRGPHHTSGTYEAFVNAIMRSGALSIPYMQQLERENFEEFQTLTRSIRQDGHFISSTNSGNIVINKVIQEKHTVGVVGFGFYQENNHQLRALTINGYLPSYDTEGSDYPLVKTLYLYVRPAQDRSLKQGLTRIIESLQDETLQNILKKQGLIVENEQTK